MTRITSESFVCSYRYYTTKAALTGNLFTLGDQYVFKYKVSLALSTIWNLFVSFLDAYNEVYALPPNRACMDLYQGRTNNQVLISFLLYIPYVLIGTFAIITDWQHYLFNVDTIRNIVTQRLRMSNNACTSLVISLIILILACLRVLIYNVLSWQRVNIIWLLIVIGYVGIIIDIVKVPIQLLIMARQNEEIDRRIIEDQRNADLEGGIQRRYRRKQALVEDIEGALIVGLNEYNKRDEVEELVEYQACFKQNLRGPLASSENTGSDVRQGPVAFSQNDIPFADDSM